MGPSLERKHRFIYNSCRMKRSTRRTIFYVFLGVFIVLGASIVLYAEGWRLDLKTFHPEKVGAIFVRAYPTDASITLDGEPILNRSGLISKGTLISDLFPRAYTLALSAPGYLPWHERVTVMPSLVAERKFAVLVPQEPVTLSTATVSAFIRPGAETIRTLPDRTIVWRGTTIGRGTIVSAATNAENVIVKGATSGSYLRYDLVRATSTNLSAAFARAGANPSSLTSIAIDPYDATKVVAMDARNLWIYDATQATSTRIEHTSPSVTVSAPFAISPSIIAWPRYSSARDASSIVLYDTFGRALHATSSSIPGRITLMKWIADRTLGVIMADHSLYIYDPSAESFTKLADDARDFTPTDDGSAIAVLEYKSVEIFPSTDALTYGRYNLPDLGSISSLVWYRDGNHLFIVYPDRIVLFDLDDLGLANLITVSAGKNPIYKPEENALYLINPEQNLVRVDFPS